ncbi:MAG: thiamine phosphate synthase [Nitrospirota bacterium]
MNDPKRFLGGLCFITGRTLSSMSYSEMALAALRGGVKWIQFRAKEMSRKELYREALSLRDITSSFNAVFIVNDHADIAAAVDADGVHLGQDDLPLKEARKVVGRRIIGISTHSLKEAIDASEGGADYIGFGPVFETMTKDAGVPKGLDVLTGIKRNAGLPVVPIGGISLGNLSSVIGTGVDTVAVSSAILNGDIERNTSAFIKLLGSEI